MRKDEKQNNLYHLNNKNNSINTNQSNHYEVKK
jgi:hypothetical protein